jgi:hypothetical protein
MFVNHLDAGSNETLTFFGGPPTRFGKDPPQSFQEVAMRAAFILAAA